MKPCNSQIEVKPAETTSFVSSIKETYDEVGIVVDVPKGTAYEKGGAYDFLKSGVKVFFDSWQASKFPKDDKSFYWYVPVEAIKAYEIPEK